MLSLIRALAESSEDTTLPVPTSTQKASLDAYFEENPYRLKWSYASKAMLERKMAEGTAQLKPLGKVLAYQLQHGQFEGRWISVFYLDRSESFDADTQRLAAKHNFFSFRPTA
jgi:hypothetical protein